MNTMIRWGKFNLVGAMGMVVQLAALAFFNRLLVGHFLYASTAAVEITLLHNFVWHLQYTWRDRRDDATRFRKLVRFHLSNGLVSMVGNLALMHLLVDRARVSLLLSNVVAILCCSIANFCLGNKWAFAQARETEPSRDPKLRTLHLPTASCWLYCFFLSPVRFSATLCHITEAQQEKCRQEIHHPIFLRARPPSNSLSVKH